MVRNMTLALVAVLAVLPFASKAHAIQFCDLADQLTQEKMNAECKAQFIGEMQNEQDKVDMARALNLWKAPEGIEISKTANSVFINIPGTDPLQISFISDDPLMVLINNKVYFDRTKEPSWSRRFTKIFAQAAKDQVAANRVLPSWFMIERAEAFPGDLPPAPKIQAGYTFSVYQGNSTTPIKGGAKDVLLAMNEDEKKTPDYQGGTFARAAHNVKALFTDGSYTNPVFNQFTCNDKGLAKGSYRIEETGGEVRGLSARPLGNNEVAIAGLFRDGTEVKVKMIPQGPDGNLCSNKFRRGLNCQRTLADFKASDPEIRRLVDQAQRRKRGHRRRSFNCSMLKDRAPECEAFFIQKNLNPQQQVISDDPKLAGKNSLISICKPDTDCKEASGRPSNKQLYDAFDPGGRAIIKAEKSAQAATESLTNKEVFINHLKSAGLDEAKAESYCKTNRKGRETCRLPSKKDLAAAGGFEEETEYPQLKEELKAANQAGKTRYSAAAKVPAEVNNKSEENGARIRQRLQEVAVSMLMYGTICKDKEGAKELDGWTHGSKFRNEDGSKITQ